MARLCEKGKREILSPISLVQVVQGELSLEQRIRKYQQTPQFLHDQNDVSGFDDDHIEALENDPDLPPISQYEDRAAEIQRRHEKFLADQKKAKLEKEKEERKAEFKAARSRYKELREEFEPPEPKEQKEVDEQASEE